MARKNNNDTSKFINANQTHIMVDKIQMGENVATIRTSMNHDRITITLDEPNRVILHTDGDYLYSNRYGKKNPKHIVSNIINMNSINDNCRMMVHTISKKTKKPITFNRRYTYEDIRKQLFEK